MQDSEKYLTLKEAAAELDVHPRTLQRYIYNKQLDATRFVRSGSSRTRIKHADVQHAKRFGFTGPKL